MCKGDSLKEREGILKSLHREFIELHSFEFSLNIFSEFPAFSYQKCKINGTTVLEPAISCVKGRSATTVLEGHR